MSDEQAADNYYSLLKVAQTASINEVMDALRLQRRHYNNRANSAPKAEDRLEAQRMIKLLEEAGRTLGDPSARELYDAKFGGSKPRLEILPVAPPVHDWPRPPGPPTPRPPGPPTPRPPGPPTPRPLKVRGSALLKWGKKHPRIAGLAIVGFLWIMASGGRGLAGSQGGPVSTPWPVGATAAGVLAPVLHGLQSCAEAATPQPANCPQSYAYVGQTSGVTWTLDGVPGSGAEISYSNSLFAVLGHAVMTLQYSTGGQPPQLLKVVPVGYDATVRWNGGHPTLVSLLPLQQEPTPAITQTRPNVTDAAIKQAFHAQFSQCISTTNPSMQMPPICPQLRGVYVGSGTKNVHWRSDADPLLNSKVTYDSASGIFHLIGSFALTVTSEDDAGNPQKQSLSGNYDAQLAVNGKTPVVLIIAQT